MCDEPLNLCSHEPGGDPSQPADVPEAVSSEDKLAKRILNNLGFCGHYMHFHGGGVSGKAPIICLLAKQPGGEMSQQELGMHFDLKPGSLSEILSKPYRKIKGVLDLSPNEYLRLERLKKAAQLLKEGENRVNEICYMVGFNSPSYFAKCFQKQFGVLPKEFVS